MLGPLWLPVLFFHWLDSAFGFSKGQKRVKYILILGYALTAMFSFFILSNLFVSTVEPKLFFNFYQEPGILYHFYFLVLYVGLFMLYGPFLLLRRYREVLNEERKRVLYLLLGLIFGAMGGVTNFFLAYDIPAAPYGNFFIPLWVLLFGYGTVRYRALGVKVIATEFLVFLIWSFLLSRVFLAADFIGRLIDIFLFLFVLVIGVLLIGSVRREVRQRETLEKLSGELKDLNEHLEQKVAEQTVEIRRAYEVEKKARIELEELDKAKDQFILTTQHHLRTPLTIIKGYLGVIEEDASNSGKSKSAVEKISQATETLSNFVNELLEVTELKARKDNDIIKPNG